MKYLLLCLSITFAVSNNLLLHKFANRGLKNTGDVLLFNSLVSCVWAAILLSLSGFEFSKQTVLWGILYGMVTAAMLFSKMQALTHGPVSVTSFIGCASLLVSTAVGVAVWHEKISVLQGIGVVLLITALFLTVSPKAEKAAPSWKYWCAAFFLCAGTIGVLQKAYQSASGGQGTGTMLALSSVGSAVLLSIAAVLVSGVAEHKAPKVPKTAYIYVLSCGIVSCLYNRINNTLSGQLPSVVFFPTFNGAVILFATLGGLILFKEKLSRSQIIGLVIGAVALTLTAGVIKL